MKEEYIILLFVPLPIKKVIARFYNLRDIISNIREVEGK